MHDPMGHEGFTRLIVAAAFARHRRRQRRWEIRPRPRGYGLYATADIRAGETILAREATSHRLVSLSEVEASWSRGARERFERNAWPLTEEIWVIWDRDPDAWMPIDHSCDPNAWLEGLDLAARRSIRPGEQITIDYATVYNERMPAFECRCETPLCRGTIRGTDHLADFVDRYGEHVSDYVRSKRAERPGVHRHGAA
jgi:D-alanine-D-alanine ligase